MLYHKREFVVYGLSCICFQTYFFFETQSLKKQDMFQFVRKSTCQRSILTFFFNSFPKTSNSNHNWFLTLVHSASQQMIVMNNCMNHIFAIFWYSFLHLRFSRLFSCRKASDHGWENEGTGNDGWDNGVSLWHRECGCYCLLFAKHP